MIAGRKELSKFIDWAADIKFADFSVWGNALIAFCLDGVGLGGKPGLFTKGGDVLFRTSPRMQTEQECEL